MRRASACLHAAGGYYTLFTIDQKLAAPMTALPKPNLKPLAISPCESTRSSPQTSSCYTLGLKYHSYPQIALRLFKSRSDVKSILFLWTGELGQATESSDAAPGAGLKRDERDEGPILLVKQALRMPIGLIFDVSFM